MSPSGDYQKKRHKSPCRNRLGDILKSPKKCSTRIHLWAVHTGTVKEPFSVSEKTCTVPVLVHPDGYAHLQ